MTHSPNRAVISGAVLVAVLAAALTLTGRASASTRQLAIIQDRSFLASPATALPNARALGARTIRVILQWQSVAPHPQPKRKPSFDGSNPRAYPASAWAPYDALVRTARQEGIRID